MPPAELPRPSPIHHRRRARSMAPPPIDLLPRLPPRCLPVLHRVSFAATVPLPPLPCPAPPLPSDSSLHCQLLAFSDLATADRAARQSRPAIGSSSAGRASARVHGCTLKRTWSCLAALTSSIHCYPQRGACLAAPCQASRVLNARQNSELADTDGLEELTIGCRKLAIFSDRCSSNEGVHDHLECFGEILKVVVVADNGTGRSKGDGFEAEAAIRACLGPYPVIDGRRANRNLACLVVQRSKASQPTASASIAASHWRISMMLGHCKQCLHLKRFFLQALGELEPSSANNGH